MTLLADIVTDVGEVAVGTAAGATIGGVLQSMQSAINLLGQLYRKEVVSQEDLKENVKAILEAVKKSAIRGTVIKVAQNVLEDFSRTEVITTVAIVGLEAYPGIIKYFKGEIGFEELYKEFGPRLLIVATISIICSIYPGIGIILISLPLGKSIWKEFEIQKSIENIREKNMFINGVYGSVSTTISNVEKYARSSTEASKEIAKSTFEQSKGFLERNVTSVSNNIPTFRKDNVEAS